jgi:nucleoside-diphosphate-sugar epimerase
MRPPLPTEDLQYVLDHTQEDWERFRGKGVFVTGATGFFGTWLLETFAFANRALDLNAHLTGLTRDPDRFASQFPDLMRCPAIQLWKGDVRDFVFPSGDFSHVIHAGTTSSAPVPPLEMLDTIVSGTRRTLDFCTSSGAKHCLLVSSGAVYGKQPEELSHVSESFSGAPDPGTPGHAYGEGKRVAELLGAIYAQKHDVRIKTARCFAFVGPHLPLDAHFAIGNFIRDALKGGPIQIQGDGTPVRSYLYAADLCVWLWKLLLGDSTGTFNVGSMQCYSISEVAHAVSSVFGGTIPVQIGSPRKESTPKRLPSRYVPDCQKFQSTHGVCSEIPLRDAIQKTARFYQPAT